MAPMKTWLTGLRATVVRFVKRTALTPEVQAPGGLPQARDEFGFYPTRRARYALMAALCQNTAYSAVHRWSHGLKVEFKLSDEVHPVFNPFYRVVEYWANTIYCGSDDPAYGDGKTRPSATPIETKNADIPPAIARVLGASEWEINKTVYARTGAMLGDVGLYAVDDTVARRTYLEVIDPNTIVEYEADTLGVCQRYAIEEPRPDPRPSAKPDAWGDLPRVIYREEGELVRDADGQPVACRFRTYLDDGTRRMPDGWGNEKSDWEEPYPFVPLVLVPHAKATPRVPFGQPEGMALIPKVLKNDDVASRFHDFIGKAVDPVILFSGGRAADYQVEMLGGKDGIAALYGAPEAKAQILLAALDLAAVDGHLDRLVEEIEKDFPEIRPDIENAKGDASGIALRTAQQRVVSKAHTRRAGYDAGLRAALTYAIRIAGIRGYDGFDAFAPAAVDADPEILAFRVDDRPVFKLAKIDELTVLEKFYLIAESADRAGVPIEAFLKLEGWSDERIKVVTDAREKLVAQGLPVGRAKQAPVTSPAQAEAVQAPGGAAA